MTQMSTDAIPFSIEISRMIELLASQIYPSPFALLRENVQNAFDAIMLRRHAGQIFEALVEVSIAPDHISVADNGIGMTRLDLRTHFWRAGSSSKNTADARAAGVVGTFGIGAMANFGIANKLEVVSESAVAPERNRCTAERATLSVTDECILFTPEAVTGTPGSVVTATMPPGKSIEVARAIDYIREFVRFVDLPVVVNGETVSQTPLEEAVPGLVASWRWTGEAVALGPTIIADVVMIGSGAGEVRVDISKIQIGGAPVVGRMILRQGAGAIRTFRNRFGLATASIPSTYQLGGVADFLLLQPTAGREALTTESLSFLNSFAAPLDALISDKLASHPEANVNPAFVSWVAGHRRWELCGELRARIEPGDSATLNELAALSASKPLLVYAGSDPGKMQHASAERPVVQLARNAQRRQCEEGYLAKFGRIEILSDEPSVQVRVGKNDLTSPQLGVIFRLREILKSDYFLAAEIEFGSISHNLPILVTGKEPVLITLDPKAANVAIILQVYEKEFGVIDHLAKDFVRTVIFPKVSHLVPSATRQGTDAFLKMLQRTRDVFEYERSDLENLTSLWKDYVAGKITMEQASVKASAVQRSYQTINIGMTGRVRDIVPDVTEVSIVGVGESAVASASESGPAPPIERTDITTDRKLLIIENSDPALNGYRCFLALSKKIWEERGDFFLQPHRTSVVWGGQKALFIFEHHSGEVGLYYDVQMREPISDAPGGGSFPTCTIVMKNQTFIPIPEQIRSAFMPVGGETKRLEVRYDLLYIDAGRR